MAGDDGECVKICEIFILFGCCCALECLLAIVTLPLLLIHYTIVRPIGWIAKGARWCHKKVFHHVEPVEVDDVESGSEDGQDDEPAGE